MKIVNFWRKIARFYQSSEWNEDSLYVLYLFFILALFTACFYHFLFWRYLNSNMTRFSSDILLPFSNSNDLNSREESFGTRLFASPVLLTKFGLSVLSVWSPGLIENHTIWPGDFKNLASYYRLAIATYNFFLNLVLLRSLKQKENLKWNCYTLICFSPIDFTFKNTFLF